MRKPWNVNIERLEPLYRPGECPPTAIYISEDAKNHTSGMILKLLDSGANAHSEERLRILSTVEEAMEKVDNPNEFFERHALDILEGLGPYLTMGTPPIKQQDGNSGEVTILSADADNMHKVRKKARNMFSKVAQHLHRKEVVIFTKEQLSVVDWSRFSTNLDYATNTTLVIYSYMERFVDVLTELNEPKSYIADMVYVGAIWSRRLLGAIEFILKTYASWGDQDRHKPEPDGPPAENSIIRFRVSEQWDNVVHTLGEMLLSLVQFLAQAAIAWQEKNGDVIEFLAILDRTRTVLN
ncbi:hypothetical protein BX666DRAFT_1025597 [Dichotomocladium elegans]|nr:hypothetical protein BX666DRAFT_1025597 [Dichotomocladium elegans]